MSTSNIQFEALENRTMMSAAPLHAAKPAPKPITAPLHVPTIKTVDPVTTSKSITYKNFATNPLFAASGPSISDINQGDLGDCWLLSTLSAVVKTDPGLIRKDIMADGGGVYTITFGGSTRINVNSDLPVMPDGQLAYAQLGNQDSTWVALMEKAYVQYANPKTDKYVSIEGGWMTTAFSALGLQSKSLYSAPDATTLLTDIKADVKAGDFITLGTQSSVPKGNPLIASHAYEVESVITNSSGTPVSLKLRNPWGNAVADDGYITVTAAQAYAAFAGVVVSHA